MLSYLFFYLFKSFLFYFNKHTIFNYIKIKEKKEKTLHKAEISKKNKKQNKNKKQKNKENLKVKNQKNKTTIKAKKQQTSPHPLPQKKKFLKTGSTL